MIAHRQPPPTAQEAEIARSSGQVLARYAETDRPLTLRLSDGEEERPIELPTGPPGRSLCSHTSWTPWRRGEA